MKKLETDEHRGYHICLVEWDKFKYHSSIYIVQLVLPVDCLLEPFQKWNCIITGFTKYGIVMETSFCLVQHFIFFVLTIFQLILFSFFSFLKC